MTAYGGRDVRAREAATATIRPVTYDQSNIGEDNNSRGPYDKPPHILPHAQREVDVLNHHGKNVKNQKET